jgi:NAD dependent epimerase/dehydratase
MKFADKNVLVTGAAGFIGSHLTERLAESGANVRALILYNSFGRQGWLDHIPAEILRKIEVFPGDIRDPFRTRAMMRDIEIVFHLASLIAVPYSYHAPESYVATNVSGTLNLLQAAVGEGVKRVVHVSTSEVYGSAQYTPIDEKHPLVAQSPYAATKIAADQLALSFARTYGLHVAVARPFNTFGPRQSTRAIIPTIITQLASRPKEMKLGSLSPQRDFTYVSDTVEGLMAVGECQDATGETINLGSGRAISIGDLARMIAELLGQSVTVTCDARRVRPPDSEVDRLLCDNHKAASRLTWVPQVSLEDGLRRTIDWFSQPANLALYPPAENYTI